MMMRVLFVVVVGLAPLAVVTVLVILGARESRSPDYWAVAPWFIVMALGACGVSTAIATITAIVHKHVEGGAGTRLFKAAAAFLLMVGALGAIVAMLGLRQSRHERDLRAEEAAAVEYARTLPEVRRAAGGPFRASAGSTRNRDGVPIRYDIYVRRPGRVEFNVLVDVAPDTRAFKLACLTRLSMGYRETTRDDCHQDESRAKGMFATDPAAAESPQ